VTPLPALEGWQLVPERVLALGEGVRFVSGPP
jgi:hypothetical protein